MLEPTTEKLLTVTEVADRLGVTHSYVCRLLRDGVMQGRKLGAKIWVIPESEAERFRESPDVGRPRSRRSEVLS